MSRILAALLSVLVVSFCNVAVAQSLASFTPTGSMITPRALHTATLLLDGRVLIAGGHPPLGGPAIIPTASAELYDPSTGTFSPTGSMTAARVSGTATLLPDGRVLVTGSENKRGSLVYTTAELYDPSTGTFTATGSMAAGHCCATLLNNGKVLMTGSSWEQRGAAAELYDPVTGTFSLTGRMNTDGNHKATL